ncbi:MAG: 16S rRNA processing protein RimM [Acetobacteraceae bacterium]|nr:16S rRNA processing protein RimM [Acetobacteraceae bacterium]
MPERRILVGVIGRPHGVRGLVRVVSYTADPADLGSYGPLSDARGREFGLRWRGAGIAELSEIVDGQNVPIADRDAAGRLTNTELFIGRNRLPPAEEDEFYLTDLIGLAAEDQQGSALGRVAAIHDYGAGASLEIERETAAPLIVPFTKVCVPAIDIPAGRLTVVPPIESEWPGTDPSAVVHARGGTAEEGRSA